ncbi:MAG: hypothetical protein PHN42_02720 [Bacilli bacterium]|nr:hypothetical protein [Bacilli bacterium]
MKQTQIEINKTLLFNYQEAYILLKDSLIMYIKLHLYNGDNDLKNIIKKYFIEQIKKYHSLILSERQLLQEIKTYSSNEEDIYLLLNELDNLMKMRFESYDIFLANYENNLYFNSFNNYNYLNKINSNIIIDEKTKQKLLINIK